MEYKLTIKPLDKDKTPEEGFRKGSTYLNGYQLKSTKLPEDGSLNGLAIDCIQSTTKILSTRRVNELTITVK